MDILTLTRYQTQTVTRSTFQDETFSVQLMPQGNAILAHGFFRTGAGSATVNFYQYTTGQDLNERTNIGSIELAAFTGSAVPITLLNIHDRVICEIVATGTVEVGVLATVIDQFAVDVDLGDIDVAATAQFLEGHVFNPSADKTTISSGIDIDTGLVEAQRIKNTRLLVDSDFSAKFSGRVTEVSLNNTTWTALPASSLTGRRAISIQNTSGGSIKINYDNTQAGFVGMLVKKDAERSYDLKDNVVIFGKSEAASAVVNVEELS